MMANRGFEPFEQSSSHLHQLWIKLLVGSHGFILMVYGLLWLIPICFFYITHGLSNMVLDYDLSRRYVHNSHSPSPGRQLAVGR